MELRFLSINSDGMEESEDEVVNIIGIYHLFFVENDDEVNHKVEKNLLLDPEPNEKKNRGRKKPLIKKVPKKEKPVECSTCARIFTTLRSLQRHIKFVHELKGLVNCDICGKQFQSGNNSLKEHKLRVHEKIRDYCDVCDKSIWKDGLLQHKRKYHPPPSCEYCKLTFKSLEELNEHIQDHINGKLL